MFWGHRRVWLLNFLYVDVFVSWRRCFSGRGSRLYVCLSVIQLTRADFQDPGKHGDQFRDIHLPPVDLPVFKWLPRLLWAAVSCHVAHKSKQKELGFCSIWMSLELPEWSRSWESIPVELLPPPRKPGGFFIRGSITGLSSAKEAPYSDLAR